jgi:hypothetical protein
MITPFGEIPNRVAARLTLEEQHEWFQLIISRRQAVSGLALGAAALAGGPLLWRQASSAEDVRVGGRHITFGADPTSQLLIEFAVPTPFRSGQVTVIGASGLRQTQPVEVQTVPGSGTRYCRAVFTGLPSDTKLDYRIIVDGSSVGGGTARTAFSGTHPFRFTAFGDQGTSAASRNTVQRIGDLDPMLHLMCGDLSYADSSGRGGAGDVFKPRLWDIWLNQNGSVTAHIPWIRVPGNHEMEPGFGMHGYAGMLARLSPGGASPLAIPVATKFRIGNVGFVGLDSNDVSYEIPANRGWTGGAQTHWLEQTLARYRRTGSGIDFVVAFMHHAPYSTNSTHSCEGGVIDEWVPLFDRYTVDLVISGHNHCFERTRPLRQGQVVSSGVNEVDSSRGTTYITAGGGGVGGEATFLRNPNKARVSTANGPEVVNQEWSISTKVAEPSVLVADVQPGDPPRIQINVVTADGRLIDSVTLVRRSAGSSGTAWQAWAIGGGAGAVALAGGATLLHRRAASGSAVADH